MINIWRTIPDAVVEPAWQFYRDTFTALAPLAAYRRLLTQGEFYGTLTDPRCLKLITTLTEPDEDSPVVGIAVITGDLASWSPVSPEFYAARFPDHYAAGRLWYVAFVGALNPIHFTDLYTTMYREVVGPDGIMLMDHPLRDSVVLGMPAGIEGVLHAINVNASSAMIDALQFWAVRFDGTKFTQRHDPSYLGESASRIGPAGTASGSASYGH